MKTYEEGDYSDIPYGFTFGYCKLCRQYEIQHFGDLHDEKNHIEACSRAGCLHPAFYIKTKGESDVVG